jgi:hypothetical protein
MKLTKRTGLKINWRPNKEIQNYEDLLLNLKLYEKALNSDQIKSLRRLKDSGNISNVLKKLKEISDNIKELCSDIDYNQISFTVRKGDFLSTSYTKEINISLSTLYDELRDIEREIYDRFFGDGYDEMFLNIQLDESNLNKIDIINGLPNFLKNIGLGKKIYKKLIKDLGYISSFNGYNPSLDSSMVWKSIVSDKDMFSFTNNENIISFWKELDKDVIMDKLKIFFKHKGNIQIDNDFLKKYNLNKEDLTNK